MKREVFKFLSGAFGGLAYAHAAVAVATSAGMLDEPVFQGRRWGVGYMWTEAIVYSAISLAFGYAGWIAKPEERLQKPTSPATNGNNRQPVVAGEPTQLVSR